MKLTKYIIFLNCLLFMRLDPISIFLQKYSILIPNLIFQKKNLLSLLFCNLYHTNIPHIYYNMISLQRIGDKIQSIYGLENYFFIVLFLAIFSNIINCFISYFIMNYFNFPYFFFSGYLGFSNIIFGLNYLFYNDLNTDVSFFGFKIHSSKVIFFDLIVTSLLFTNTSLFGHLSGIIVGWFLKNYIL